MMSFILLFVFQICTGLSTHLDADDISHKFDLLEQKVADLQSKNRELEAWKEEIEQVLNGKKRKSRLLLPNENLDGIAFSAYMSASFSAVAFGTNRELVYDNIECNVGNGYENFTGSFHTPQSGTYAFTWTVCASGADGGEMGVELMVNSRTHGAIYADSETPGEEDCATGFVIQKLIAGDVVFTKSHHKATPQGSIRSDQYRRTSFSGWRLF